MLCYYINTPESCSHQSLILKWGYCGSIKLSHTPKLAQESNPAAVLQWFMVASTDMPFPLCHACLKLLNYSWLGFEEFEQIPVWYILGKQNSALKSRQTSPIEGKREGKFIFVHLDHLFSVCAGGTFICPYSFCVRQITNKGVEQISVILWILTNSQDLKPKNSKIFLSSIC